MAVSITAKHCGEGNTYFQPEAYVSIRKPHKASIELWSLGRMEAQASSL